MEPPTGEIHRRDEKVECVIEWTIQNFFEPPAEIIFLHCSPSFYFLNENWHLTIYPNCDYGSESKQHIYLHLYRETDGPPVRLDYTLGLKTVNEDINPREKYSHVFGGRYYCESFRVLSRSELFDRKSELAPGNAVTVVCRLQYPANFKATGIDKAVSTEDPTECSYCGIALRVHEDISSHLQECAEFPIKCPKCGDVIALKNWHDHKCQTTGEEVTEKLLSDLKSMMLKGDHSDVVITVKGEEFRLHKSVLASRSPYFHSMFNCSMKEKNTGIVTIDDCEPNVFRSFSQFVYTGEVDKLTLENVCDLYELTDKYQEDQLKRQCVHFMMNALSIESFCDFTVLAFKHDEKELLDNAIKFLAIKIKEILPSVKWQTLLTEYPIQANELLIKALNLALVE